MGKAGGQHAKKKEREKLQKAREIPGKTNYQLVGERKKAKGKLGERGNTMGFPWGVNATSRRSWRKL